MQTRRTKQIIREKQTNQAKHVMLKKTGKAINPVTQVKQGKLEKNLANQLSQAN